MQVKFNFLPISLLAIVMLTISCSKKNDDTPAAASCSVTEIISGTDDSKLEYDATGKVTKITSLSSGSVNSIYTFEYGSNGLATKINVFATSVSANPDAYYTPVHDAGGKLIQLTNFTKNTAGTYQALGSVTLQYDANNLLVKELFSTSGGYLRYEYSNLNVSKVYYLSGTGGTEYLVVAFTKYDDKISPTFSNIYVQYLLGLGSSKNNPLEETDYTQNGTTSDLVTTSYTYNSSNYPLTAAIIDKPTGGSNQTYSTSYTYQCK